MTKTSTRRRKPAEQEEGPVASTSALPGPPPVGLERMPQPRLRPRAYSCFPSASAAPDAARSSVHRTQSTGAAPSSLVDSLDLSSPLLPIEDGTPRSRLPLEAGWLLYLLSRVEEAEAGVRALRAWIVVENGSSSSGDSTSSSDGGLELEGITEDEEDVRVQPVEMEWEVVRRRGSKRAPVGRPLPVVELKSGKEALEAIGLLEHFISTSTKFLNGIKLQLTSLSPSPLSTSPFSLSPDARLQLDHFLADYHPLPSFPSLDLLPLLSRLDDGKKSAAHSATSLFNRVVEELGGLQLILTSLPSNPPLEAVREYFVEESERLSKIIHSLQSTTTSTLHSLSTLSPLSTLQSSTSTTLSHLYVEATELSSLLSHSSTAAFDEATRIYHRALEGGRKRLLRYEELPQDWKNNQHILSGYRFIGIDRWGAILRSAFEFHNETINIHSHFLGFLSLLYLLFSILPVSPAASPTSHWGDFAISLLFILAGLKCLLCSTIWHLLSGCAHTGWHRGAACVDYVGISGLIAASVMGMEYYGLYCRPELAKGYMTFTAALGVTGMIIPWKPWFNMRKYKMWRVAFFVGTAASAVMPLAHMSVLFGLAPTVQFFSPVLPSIGAYLFGLSFYANQFPECTSPGRWDHFFASHQVWHAAIVMAIWTHWRAINIWAGTAGSGLSCSL